MQIDSRVLLVYVFDVSSHSNVLCVWCKIPAVYSIHFVQTQSFVCAVFGITCPFIFYAFYATSYFICYFFEASSSLISYVFDVRSKFFILCLWWSVELLTGLPSRDYCSATSLAVFSLFLILLRPVPLLSMVPFVHISPNRTTILVFKFFSLVHEQSGLSAFPWSEDSNTCNISAGKTWDQNKLEPRWLRYTRIYCYSLNTKKVTMPRQTSCDMVVPWFWPDI